MIEVNLLGFTRKEQFSWNI